MPDEYDAPVEQATAAPGEKRHDDAYYRKVLDILNSGRLTAIRVDENLTPAMREVTCEFTVWSKP